MTRPRILVLGSKPEAAVPATDHTYCANCASHYYRDALQSNRPIVNVVAGAIVARPHKGQKPEVASRHRKQYRRLLDARPDSLVIVHGHREQPAFQHAETCFREDGFDLQLRHIPYDDRQALIYKHTGLSGPIRPERLGHLPIRYGITYARDRARGLLLEATGKEVQYKNLFRISMGVFALIYAIDAHGSDATYIVSGIGVSDRNRYQDGFGLKRGPMTPHVHADIRVLRILAQRYEIVTTEEDLTDILGNCARAG